MLKAVINYSKCLRCQECLAAKVCAAKAIYKIELEGPAVIDKDHCYGCGDCTGKCFGKAIIIQE